GGRDEVTRAARALAVAALRGEIAPEAITEATVAGVLDTAGLPDPDLVIRTSGETRVSNFLPWQAAYAEYEFSPVLWPDFLPAHLAEIMARFGLRERRFGAVAAG
ncbi:MAG: undecaprenyl diphosphate synthase family protein, partial [Gemmobacter sp.]